jgi:hypothetical protein
VIDGKGDTVHGLDFAKPAPQIRHLDGWPAAVHIRQGVSELMHEDGRNQGVGTVPNTSTSSSLHRIELSVSTVKPGAAEALAKKRLRGWSSRS